MRQLSSMVICLGLLCAAAPAHAIDRNLDMSSLEVSQLGDTEMTCQQISHEVSTMDEVIMFAREEQDEAQMASNGVTVAKTVGSYFIGSFGGALGIIAAGYLANEMAKSNGEEAFSLQDAATQRRRFMEGIYNAKGCSGPLPIDPVTLSEIEPAAGDEYENEYYQKPQYNE